MELESVVLIDGTKFKKGEFRLNKEIIRIIMLTKVDKSVRVELKGTPMGFTIPYHAVLYYLAAE